MRNNKFKWGKEYEKLVFNIFKLLKAIYTELKPVTNLILYP